ncbi:hypothetical protein NMY22_g18054 [Coprinellus aureogranulatus]|nr:hypothetical protein NMY22_g18054 [Coprinellus aureogranulatus]
MASLGESGKVWLVDVADEPRLGSGGVRALDELRGVEDRVRAGSEAGDVLLEFGDLFDGEVSSVWGMGDRDYTARAENLVERGDGFRGEVAEDVAFVQIAGRERLPVLEVWADLGGRRRIYRGKVDIPVERVDGEGRRDRDRVGPVDMKGRPPRVVFGDHLRCFPGGERMLNAVGQAIEDPAMPHNHILATINPPEVADGLFRKLTGASHEPPIDTLDPPTCVDNAKCTVALRLWNVNGGFLVKMACSDFREEIKRYDVNIFQETKLEKDHVGMIEAIEGFDLWSVEREYKQDSDAQWGGVVVLAREELNLRRCEEMISPDILVLQSDEFVLVGAYILPEGGERWRKFADVSPYEKLEEVLTLLAGDTRQVLVIGDLNARVGGRSTWHSGETRASEDTVVTARGHALLDACRKDDYHIFNGLDRFGAGGGRMTSHHKGCGEAVVDYVVGNAYALKNAILLEVLQGRPGRSDHSEVVLRASAMARMRSARKNPRRKRERFVFPLESEVDRLVVQAVESIPPPEDEMKLLYGPEFCSTKTVQVYVDGSSIGNRPENSKAGSGVFFGLGNKRNVSVQVPDAQTNSRAEIYAVWQALQICDTHMSLVVNSDSEYVINMLTEWAADREGTGWRVVNGDLFRDVAFMIRAHPAPVTFRKVKAHSGNAHNDAADALAKEGTTKPAARPYEPLDRQRTAQTKCESDPGLKRRRGDDDNAGLFRENEEEARSAITAEYARDKQQQLECRMRLVNAKTPFQFYKAFNALRLPRSCILTGFNEEAMRDVFIVRMNPIVPIPPTFDARRITLTRGVAATTIQDGLGDLTPLKSLSRPFELSEIEMGKIKLRQRWGSAVGEDEVSYRDICRMDNTCLLNLMNRCIELGDIPRSWLRTRLVGLCKKGKSKDDPESYRTIALESCFLKLMTGLVKERLVEMADSQGLLPASQNGFREGYRTNNNVFVLRCAVEKADAEGKPLYAAFVDLTNAFPSTDQDTLWLKLRKWGAGGPIFDWLRKLYRDMTYSVFHEGQTSDDFKSSIGILIGDTCSPILWILYMADLPDYIPKDSDGIHLGSVSITNLEQADDVVLLSTTREGLQRKIDGMYRWCAVNFMRFNASKSSILIIARNRPRKTPTFEVGTGELRVAIAVVNSVIYLGFTLSSTPDRFLRQQYKAKEEKAKTACRVISGVQQLVGILPVHIATMLYMALVDPHLTHGCDVTVDCVKAAWEILEAVQETYLRKVLNVGMLCILHIAVLAIRNAMPPPGHYVREAMRESIALDINGKSSWIGDVRKSIRALPGGCDLPGHDDLEDADCIEDLRRRITAGMRRELQRRVDASPKLYLLHGRLEPDKNGTLNQPVSMMFRHYLRVNNTRHRVALSRVILSGHKYGIEAMRRTREDIPREDRVCRLCGAARDIISTCRPDEVKWMRSGTGGVREELRRLISIRSMIATVAAYAYDVETLMKTLVDW